MSNENQTQGPTPPKDRKDLFEGDFMGLAVSGEVGKGKGGYKSRIEFEITDGDRKGWRLKFEGKLDEPNIVYTKRAMLAVGWQGGTSATFAADVAGAKRVVPIKVRIANFTRPDGSVSWWSSVDRVGGYTPPLESTPDDVAKMDSWFAETGGSNGGGGGGHEVPPPGDQDLPFANSDAAAEPSPISRVVR